MFQQMPRTLSTPTAIRATIKAANRLAALASKAQQQQIKHQATCNSTRNIERDNKHQTPFTFEAILERALLNQLGRQGSQRLFLRENHTRLRGINILKLNYMSYP
jgi:hypothetical protein